MRVLAAPRPTASLPSLSDSDFEVFLKLDAQAKDERDVLATVIPALLGSRTSTTVFGNLEHLTDGTIIPERPDLYHGASSREVWRLVRDRLDHHIIPSTNQYKLITPNFFIEVQGPGGCAAVADRQARYHGALVARAMHKLQNYGKGELEYDGNAYTFSSTYHSGLLRIHAHHLTAPMTEDGRPEYHTTEIASFSLRDDLGTFIKGVTALLNARDLAEHVRDNFIRRANARARTEIAHEILRSNPSREKGVPPKRPRSAPSVMEEEVPRKRRAQEGGEATRRHSSEPSSQSPVPGADRPDDGSSRG